MPVTEQIHYKKPGWFTRNIFNRTVSGLTRAGVSIFGSRVLEVKGRSSGLPRQTPVNVLTLEGRQYLVSPRGEGEWVKNLRASGGQLDLLLGRGQRDAPCGRGRGRGQGARAPGLPDALEVRGRTILRGCRTRLHR